MPYWCELHILSFNVSRNRITYCITKTYHLLCHTTISLTVHLPLVLTLISNSPRILISRQTIGIEIDNSITYRYAAPPSVTLLPCLYIFCPLCHSVFRSPCYHVFTYSVHYVIMASVPLLLCLYILCPLCHYVFRSPCYHVFTYSVHYGFRSFCLSLWLLSLMSLWLPHHSVCHFFFFYVNYFYHLTILSIIV